MLVSMEERQPALLELFSRTFQNKRLGHAYLFEGARGTGKKEMARWIAKLLFCQAPADGKPCQSCRNCRRMDEQELPDLIELEPDGQSIKVDQIRQLKAEFHKSKVEASKKVYIVEDAEKMTISAANSLLTFLEEPGAETYIFLLTTAKENILPTIRSRCQIIHFQPLKRDVMTELLLQEGIAKSDAEVLAAVTNDLAEAKELAADEQFRLLREKTWSWFQLLVAGDAMAFLYVQMNLLEAVKDRAHGFTCLDLLLFHYRDLLYVSYQQEKNIIHQQYLHTYQSMAQSLRRQTGITDQMETILAGKQMLQANVQLQGVLEGIAIHSLQNLKGSK